MKQAVCKFFLESVFLEETLNALLDDWGLQDLMDARAEVGVLTEHQLQETGYGGAILGLHRSGLGLDYSAE